MRNGSGPLQSVCRPERLSRHRKAYLAIIDRLDRDGAEGVIPGCTEIGLLVGESDTDLPVFDLTQLHALMEASFSLEG